MYVRKQRTIFIILVEDVCKKLENHIKLIYLIYRDLKNETTGQLDVIVIHMRKVVLRPGEYGGMESGKVEGWRKNYHDCNKP